MRRVGSVLALATTLTLGSAARATLQVFTIDPALSVVSVAGSELTAHLGGLIGDVTVPLQSQVGNIAGVGGIELPDGTTSDGLRTALGGQLLVDRTPGAIQFRTQITDIVPATSGAWRPGLVVDPFQPGAAQVAGYLADASIGFSATIAVREAAFVYSSAAPIALSASGNGFDFDARQLFRVADGQLDFDTSLAGLDGSDSLAELSASNLAASGRLDQLGGTFERLTIPVDVELLLGPEFFDGLPFSATVRLAGQIVATRGVIPEPSTALLLAGGAGLLGAQRRFGRRRGARSDRRRRLLHVGLVLLLACACKSPIKDEECGNGIDDNKDGLTDCEDPFCAELDARCITGEICNDGEDNDFDGATDCEDNEECCEHVACQASAACLVETDCANEVDDDDNGLVDCEDPDCSTDPLCNLGPAPIESISCVDQEGTVLVNFANFDQANDPNGCADTARIDASIGGTDISIEHHVEGVDDAASEEREVALVCTHLREGANAGAVQCSATVHVAVSYGPGGDHLFLGLRSARFIGAGSLGGGSAPALWQCAGRFGEISPFDEATEVPANPNGGSCFVEIETSCQATGVNARGACRDTLFAKEVSGTCHRDADCAPGEQCGPLGCQAGSPGDLCADNHDCADAADSFCSSAGVCSDGGAGSFCAPELGDFECAGLRCDADGVCRSELCANGVDDDGDLASDCDDPECAGSLLCPPSS